MRRRSIASSEAISRYGERFVRRVFTEGEIAYCREQRDFASSFAARFAAKEAAMKALGTGHSQGVFWTGIEVVRRHGPPRLHFHGGAAKRFAAIGWDRFTADADTLQAAGHRPRPAAPGLTTGASTSIPRAPRASLARSFRNSGLLSGLARRFSDRVRGPWLACLLLRQRIAFAPVPRAAADGGMPWSYESHQ